MPRLFSDPSAKSMYLFGLHGAITEAQKFKKGKNRMPHATEQPLRGIWAVDSRPLILNRPRYGGRHLKLGAADASSGSLKEKGGQLCSPACQVNSI